jgi:hypothetical protein
MERGRAPRQLARAKSGGSDSDTNEPDTKEVEALADALNHSAELVQTLWFKFLYFMAALVVVIGTTTHRTLFLESPLKLPPLPDIPIRCRCPTFRCCFWHSILSHRSFSSSCIFMCF